MSDRPNETNKMLRQIAICNDVLLDVFDYVCPAVLGLSFALVSARFAWIVDSHIATLRWSLGEWEIRRNSEGTGAKLVGKDAKGNEKQLPMPEVPPPDNVIGFKKVTISFVDQSVLAFLHRIAPRLFSNHQQFLKVLLDVKVNESNSWSIVASKIWPLLAQNVFDFSILGGPQCLDELRRLVSYSVLTDCVRLQGVTDSKIYPAGPPSDSSVEDSSCALYKWLLTPHSSGGPKALVYDVPTSEFMPTVSFLREQFINANTRAFFSINFMHWRRMRHPFRLVNERTGERMRLYKFNKDFSCWVLERCPTEWGTERWAEWSTEMRKVHAKGNEVVVRIEDTDVDMLLNSVQVSSD